MKLARVAGIGTMLLLVAALAFGAALSFYRDELLAFATRPSSAPGEDAGERKITIVIPKGAGPRQIAGILEEKGVIGDATLFYRWVRFVAKKQNAMKAGEYELSPRMSPEQILALLEVGKPPELRFTIPEGLRKEEVAAVIAAAGFSTKEKILEAMNDPALVAAFGVPDKGAAGQDGVPGGVEGYLFPDTYQFPKSATPVQILKRMRARLDEVLDDKMRARMSEMGWDLHKVLTLAAIVEKETGAKEERPRIASVFHNRMKRGMKMQTDPTVIYGIPNYDGNIRKSDLLRDHPYNTYVIAGLPPGPIAQPGIEAIKAVLWPLETKDLYFVAKGDSGEHQFCPTLECHNAAVQKWQIEFYAKRRGG
jgi:UPF0755 protein